MLGCEGDSQRSFDLCLVEVADQLQQSRGAKPVLDCHPGPGIVPDRIEDAFQCYWLKQVYSSCAILFRRCAADIHVNVVQVTEVRSVLTSGLQVNGKPGHSTICHVSIMSA